MARGWSGGVWLLLLSGRAIAGPAVAPPLAPPTGSVVSVSTEAQLQAAVSSLTSNQTILLAAGTYTLSSTLYINGTFSNVAIRGATGNRDDVVLVGRGMSNASYGAVPHGIWVGGNVNGVTIANLTVRDVYFHTLIFNAGTESPRVYNVRLRNAGQQLLKSNPDSAGGGVDNGVVEYSIFEYATRSRDYYTNGVDVHRGRDWIIRHNEFRNIRAPDGQLAGPAILMWNASSGTLADGNTFIDCQREIAFGLIERTPDDHSGGVIRNNFIYRSAGVDGDAAIGVFDSPNTRVLHNSIFISATYYAPIEYRFPHTTGVAIANNLLDGQILARDGASAALSGNYTTAQAAMFVNAASADLHLRTTASAAIDRGISVTDATTDWDGQSRPAGGAPDIGADETGAASAPAPPRNLRLVSG